MRASLAAWLRPTNNELGWSTSFALSIMAENYCPVCDGQLTSEAINVAEGVALCACCGQLSKLSEVVSHKRPVEEVLIDPPPGCSVTDLGHEVSIHASLRSIGGFLVTFGVALFWNGIVSVFVLLAAAALYTNLVGPLPEWFPAPDFDDQMSMGMTLFLCIFLTPFILVGALMVGAVFLNVAGRIRVVIGDDRAAVRTAIGFIGWTQRFNPTRVRAVRLRKTSWQTNGQPSEAIVIEADRVIKFGSNLKEERRLWLQTILRELLTNTKPDQRGAILAMATGKVT